MRATIYIWIRFEQAITFVVIAAIHILDKVVCKLLSALLGTRAALSLLPLLLSHPLHVSFFIFSALTLSIPTLYLLPPMHHHENDWTLLMCTCEL